MVQKLKDNYIVIISAVILTVLYFSSRIVNLTLLPIFTDEAIYLRWAQIALHDPSLRFISLIDGKQPSFIWVVMILMKYIHDPLIAGRMASVFAGFVGVIGIGVFAWYLFNDKRVGIWAAFIYIISPFFLLYDRLALYDTLTAAFFTWGLFLSVMLSRTIRLDAALILGMVIGGGMLTKTSAFFTAVLLPVSLVLFNKKNYSIHRFFVWMGLALIALGIGLVMYNALRVSPWFYIIGRKNQEFVYTFSELFRHPLQYFLPNLNGLSKWLVSYLTVPFVVVIILGIISRVTPIKNKLYLALCFLIPFLYLSFFGKVLFPRFILLMTVPLYVFTAKTMTYITQKIKKRSQLILILLVILLYSFYFDYQIIFSPELAPLPDTDKHQYIDDWPSGYGVNEVIGFLKDQAKYKKIFIASEGTFGLFPYSLELYLYDNPNIEIKGYWPMNDDKIQHELVPIAKNKPTYLVFKDTQEIPTQWPLKLIRQYRRGRGKTFLRLYQVIPRV